MKWMTHGIMPSEEDVFNKKKKLSKSNEHAAHYQVDDHLELDDSDFKAMCIAMAQIFFPVVLGFAGTYILVILFITKVWLR
ncbi:hypothetical protein [Fusibacter sp. JL216-2]|uniref:hypothetical protein n=1 Tax=Fusibacter sp. JL216-2 TaxID=3071453 RepID=UPI003D3265C2|tara:strand:- start:344 stop:586 length:243 start_codon:yes stop_codon:yes gene_type:complete